MPQDGNADIKEKAKAIGNIKIDKMAAAIAWLLSAVAMSLCLRSIWIVGVMLAKNSDGSGGTEINTDVIAFMLTATIWGIIGALYPAWAISEACGISLGNIIYPKIFLKNPAQRIAAVETMIVKRQYAEAQEALEEMLRDDPKCIAAGTALAKLLEKWKGQDGKGEASALLISLLARFKKAQPGAIDAVILLADYLDETGMPNRAQAMLLSELDKGYCQADRKIIQRRLADMEFKSQRASG